MQKRASKLLGFPCELRFMIGSCRCDERCFFRFCRSAVKGAFLCKSRNIMPAADAQTMGGLEKGNMSVSVCVRLCVCCDSLQRKLDMCLVTWDMVYGWPVNFGG